VRTARRVALVVGAAAVVGSVYVGWHAVQEDTHMRPGSPLAWLLVDADLWHLEPPPECVRVGYYTTSGDGPKLPGSDTTLECAFDRTAAERWARRWFTDRGFRPYLDVADMVEDGERLGSWEIAELDRGGVSLRINLDRAPR
jgi:hypothetical protein